MSIDNDTKEYIKQRLFQAARVGIEGARTQARTVQLRNLLPDGKQDLADDVDTLQAIRIADSVNERLVGALLSLGASASVQFDEQSRVYTITFTSGLIGKQQS